MPKGKQERCPRQNRTGADANFLDNIFAAAGRKQGLLLPFLPLTYGLRSDKQCLVGPQPMGCLPAQHIEPTEKTRRFLSESTVFLTIFTTSSKQASLQAIDSHAHAKNTKNGVQTPFELPERRFLLP